MSDSYDQAVPVIPVESEKERIRVLRSLQILDTPYEQLYDDITKIAASILNTRSACISFVDEDRVWFKSLKGTPSDEINRGDSFCQYTVAGNGLFEVQDATKHEHFKNNPYVTGQPHWQYYAGVPLKVRDQVNVGALCLLDTKPNKLSKEQENTLTMLAETVVHLISVRRNLSDYNNSQHLLQVLQEINEDFIQSPESKYELFKKMLDYVLQVTGSEYGFIGEAFTVEGKRALRTYVITDVSKENEGRGFTSDPAQRGMVFGDYNTLFGHTLRTGESIICNSIDCDTKKGAVPDGHPLLGCYMGLAINDSKGNLIGVMGLANKPSGYTEADQIMLQPFLAACGTMIISLRSLQRRNEIEEEKKEIAGKLLKAQAIAKLGSWEYDMATNKVHWSDELYSIYELPKTQETLDYKSYHNRLHPEDIERNDAIAIAAIRERKEFSFEERLLFPDGRTKIVQVIGCPVYNEEDIVVGIQGTTQDITAQKRQEEVLQRFFNLAADLYCIATKDGFILRHSLSFRSVLGYSEEDLRTMPIFELIHPEDRERTRLEIDFILRGGTSRNFENRYKKKNGEYVILSWTTTFDEESQMVYASGQDVSEKRELEETLLESQIEAEKSKAKDIFLANMSHEIRTPLNAIMGFNDILSQTSLTAEQRRNVDFITNASKKLSVLINDILDISKLESGKLDLEYAPFRLEEVARGVVQMYTLQARAKGVKLLFSYDQEIPEVLMGDETRLSQILLNLISNAVKFTEQGSIELRILEEAHSNEKVVVHFEVKDTGIGIAKEKLDVVFERFTQAETYTTRVYGGTGLGLNIVRSLVDLHKGQLEVDSAPGVGSTFRFSIEYPIASATEILQMEGPKQNTDSKLLSDMRILLVEDNEHNQILAETYLLKQNARVEIAVNGKVAIELLKQKSFDAILMDIQMPIMDGLTTTEMLRKELKIETPVIACSAHAMTSERLKCIEVGMNDYISKPYTEEGLVSVLAKYRKPQVAREQSNIDDFAEVLEKLEERMSSTYVQKIVGVFKQRLPGEIAMLERAVEERDFKLMEERSHYQSGSMSSLKFKRGYQLAYDAERAAAERKEERATLATDKLIDYLQELLNYLNTSVN
jgi:PAS domain S-box-containing protein